MSNNVPKLSNCSSKDYSSFKSAPPQPSSPSATNNSSKPSQTWSSQIFVGSTTPKRSRKLKAFHLKVPKWILKKKQIDNRKRKIRHSPKSFSWMWSNCQARTETWSSCLSGPSTLSACSKASHLQFLCPSGQAVSIFTTRRRSLLSLALPSTFRSSSSTRIRRSSCLWRSKHP